jgi:hypothetical protein
MVHSQYQQGLGQGTKPQQHSNLQSLIPHQPAQPKVVCPFSAHGPSGCTTTLPGLQHRLTRKSQSIVAPGVPTSLRRSPGTLQASHQGTYPHTSPSRAPTFSKETQGEVYTHPDPPRIHKVNSVLWVTIFPRETL